MHAVGAGTRRNFDAVVDDQQGAGGVCQRNQPARAFESLRTVGRLIAILNDAHSGIQRLFDNIEDIIEAVRIGVRRQQIYAAKSARINGH